MTVASDADALLVAEIRRGSAAAWEDLIGRFEGRLLAFVDSRLHNRAASEDVVQESFIGFLTSLPNYDRGRSLENYLFSIAAHKLTDHLRREGRRPTVSLVTPSSGRASDNLPSPGARPASTLARSAERRRLEEGALTEAMQQQIDHWRSRGDWQKIQCLELLLVRGLANKQAAELLGISEQAAANFKFDFLAKLRAAVRKQGLPEDVFPELNTDA